MKGKGEQMAMSAKERMAKFRLLHPDKAKLDSQKNTQRQKLVKVEVLTHYGNGKLSCVKCGMDNPSCLSIDHINGGGNKERILNKTRLSSAFYRWLKKNQYPDGYQTLCMNCQFIKRFERNEHN